MQPQHYFFIVTPCPFGVTIVPLTTKGGGGRGGYFYTGPGTQGTFFVQGIKGGRRRNLKELQCKQSKDNSCRRTQMDAKKKSRKRGEERKKRKRMLLFRYKYERYPQDTLAFPF
jgi:hypothetical protein